MMRRRERSYLVKIKATKWAERTFKELNWDEPSIADMLSPGYAIKYPSMEVVSWGTTEWWDIQARADKLKMENGELPYSYHFSTQIMTIEEITEKFGNSFSVDELEKLKEITKQKFKNETNINYTKRST